MSDTDPGDTPGSDITPAGAAASPSSDLPAAPPPMPIAPAATAAEGSNGFAVASLVLGLLAVVLFFTIWIPFVLGILAIVFGAIGISRANKMGGRQKGLAIAGIVCGAAGIVIDIAFLALLFSVLDEPAVRDVFNSLVPSASPRH
jgi:hypothetical protein